MNAFLDATTQQHERLERLGDQEDAETKTAASVVAQTYGQARADVEAESVPAERLVSSDSHQRSVAVFAPGGIPTNVFRSALWVEVYPSNR